MQSNHAVEAATEDIVRAAPAEEHERKEEDRAEAPQETPGERSANVEHDSSVWHAASDGVKRRIREDQAPEEASDAGRPHPH